MESQSRESEAGQGRWVRWRRRFCSAVLLVVCASAMVACGSSGSSSGGTTSTTSIRFTGVSANGGPMVGKHLDLLYPSSGNSIVTLWSTYRSGTTDSSGQIYWSPGDIYDITPGTFAIGWIEPGVPATNPTIVVQFTVVANRENAVTGVVPATAP